MEFLSPQISLKKVANIYSETNEPDAQYKDDDKDDLS
jgi:hypothetical protein